MSEENEISAESVVEAIVRGDAPNGEYVLDGKTIRGKFDLRHRVISIAIRITNCTFEDEVDLGYCEFKQCVDFSVSRFKKEFYNRAIYQKDIICDQAIFEDEVIFNGCKCEGTGFFNAAKFENVDKEVNFIGAKFGVNLNCIGTIFRGGAIFNAIKCEGNGFFRDAKFENVNKEIDFIGAKFDGDLDCTGAVFKGGASFNSIQCERNGFFKNTKFENMEKEINFGHAKFSANLSCTGVVFKGGANFNSIQCKGTGSFENTKFENMEKEINFGRAKFGVDLDCTGTVFKSGAIFDGIQCEDSGFFKDAKFENVEKEIDFTYTKFDNLEFQNATFAGNVDFLHAQVSRSFALYNTKFKKLVNLNCVNLHNFSLMDTRDRYGSDSLPFKGDVDLRRLSFTVFEGTKEQQRHVVEKQAPDKFSIDPYLQFEKYYNSIGDESYAKNVYYEGRKKLRENARSKANSDINWTKGKLILDWLNWIFLGYNGTKLWHTFCALAGFLLFGTFVFWSDEAMIPKTVSANNTGFMMTIEHNFQNDLDKGILSESLRQQFKNKILPISDQAYIVTIQYGSEWYINSYSSNDVIYKAKMKGSDIRIYRTIYPDYKRFFHRLGYSLDMLLPVINIKIADEYKSPSGGYEVYMVIHRLAGWVLIPLLISSLAGVLRKR